MPVLVVPAGRCFRRSLAEKWIDPQPDKGTIELSLVEGITQFVWRNKDTSTAEEDLLIFPGEATFHPVSQDPSNRAHVLEFNSSNQKYFFWFQRANNETDARAYVDINALLQDPSYQIGTAALPSLPRDHPAGGAPLLSRPTPGSPVPRVNVDEIHFSAEIAQLHAGESSTSTSAAPAAAAGGDQDIARILEDWARGVGQDDEARLPDVLSPSIIAHLLSSDPSLSAKLAPLLPASLELGSAPTADALLPVLSTPQFSDAIASLDSALRSGGLPGPVMREIGLPESAGGSVRAFLAALLKRDDTDRMETD
ncbi:hypothetical protein Q5752_000708 [Cryptotrichosporon argae]